MVNIKIIQVLRTYCYGLHRDQLDDLRSSIESGRFPWFRDEFATAIRTAAFARAEWEKAVGPVTHRTTSRHANVVRAEQRVIWSHVLSGRPFPARSRATACSTA